MTSSRSDKTHRRTHSGHQGHARLGALRVEPALDRVHQRAGAMRHSARTRPSPPQRPALTRRPRCPRRIDAPIRRSWCPAARTFDLRSLGHGLARRFVSALQRIGSLSACGRATRVRWTRCKGGWRAGRGRSSGVPGWIQIADQSPSVRREGRVVDGGWEHIVAKA